MRAHCLGKPRASDPVGDGRTDQSKRRLRLLFHRPALFYGTLMARIPALKARAALSESEIGGLLLAPGISAVLMIAASSRLVARFGRRRFLVPCRGLRALWAR